MKTTLPKSIENNVGAKVFLYSLYRNGEAFHPEDDAHDIIWHTCNPTEQERDKLNKLMEQVYIVADFDPCGFLLHLEEKNRVIN